MGRGEILIPLGLLVLVVVVMSVVVFGAITSAGEASEFCARLGMVAIEATDGGDVCIEGVPVP